MIPQDKYGNPIYPHIFEKMKKNAKVLMMFGFKESKNKPNLFYLNTDDAVFFADMRSSEIIPIWEDTRPLMYCKFEKEYPEWKQRRIVGEFFGILMENGCACRFSHEDELLGDHQHSDDNGYCEFCGKDFQDEGSFCSKECEKADEETYKDHCAVCGKDLDWKNVIHHHVNYKEEKKIPVCRSCHTKIHKSEKMPNLKPDKEEKEKYYEKKRNCEYCGKEFKTKRAVERHEKVCYIRYRKLAGE